MIEPSPQATAWLSVLLGAWLLAGGLGVLLHASLWPEIVADFERSPALVAITGAVAFAVGALIVTFHNLWTSPAAILISAAGWMAVLEGLTLLAVPNLWLRIARAVMKGARIWGVVMLVLGAFLLSSALVSQSLVPNP
jgi:uncharacterized protein YjeT (DUF2065 family)